MKLVLIRHGQPAWADEKGLANVHPPLTPQGLEQAEKLGEHWASRLQDAALYVSPMLRAKETIAPLAAKLNKQPVVLDWLQEIGLPERWHGLPAEVMTNDLITIGIQPRKVWMQHHVDGDTQYDGEHSVAFNARIRKGLDGFLADHNIVRNAEDPEMLWDTPDTWDNDRVAVLVCHVGTMGVILAHLLPAVETPWEWERFACSHSGVSVIETKAHSTGHIWALRLFNDTNHLGGFEL